MYLPNFIDQFMSLHTTSPINPNDWLQIKLKSTPGANPSMSISRLGCAFVVI